MSVSQNREFETTVTVHGPFVQKSQSLGTFFALYSLDYLVTRVFTAATRRYPVSMHKKKLINYTKHRKTYFTVITKISIVHLLGVFVSKLHFRTKCFVLTNDCNIDRVTLYRTRNLFDFNQIQ